ncbi:Mobile element protein [Dehalobacter sp. UNSWDHB]|nr:Mobile element protein [Dehalobacter sp. UNSWDHB]OCZ49970.1 hypothetical protein A7D23_01110 [Dehalobacter sp. TeCB1]
MVRSHLDFVQRSIAELDEKLDRMIAPYESAVTLLCTIPGVDKTSAITIISEIGTDMSQFASSKRLCCWAGLTPGNNESAGKEKSVRITRAGVYLKPALVQVTHTAVKSDKAPYYKIKYERIYKRRGKKRAVIAIAMMILTAIYNMFVTGEEWNPSDLYKIDMPQEMLEKQKEKATTSTHNYDFNISTLSILCIFEHSFRCSMSGYNFYSIRNLILFHDKCSHFHNFLI